LHELLISITAPGSAASTALISWGTEPAAITTAAPDDARAAVAVFDQALAIEPAVVFRHSDAVAAARRLAP
jgi:hypothetical protein